MCACVFVISTRGFQHWNKALTVLVGGEAVKKMFIYRSSSIPKLTSMYCLLKTGSQTVRYMLIVSHPHPGFSGGKKPVRANMPAAETCATAKFSKKSSF